MADVTFAEVAQLAVKLTPDEQQALIKLLQERSQASQEQQKTISQEFEETFGLRVFHVDKWPEGLTLRREDEYGDDGR